MLANELENAPVELIVGNDVVKCFVDGMRMLVGRLVHPALAIDVMYEETATGFDQRYRIGQIGQRAFICVITVDQHDPHLVRMLLRQLQQPLLGVAAT